MKIATYKACIMLCAGLTTYSSAATLDSENLLLSSPPGFKVGYQKVEGRETLAEFVPETESVQDWNEMWTVQVFRGTDVNSVDYVKDGGSLRKSVRRH